MIIPIHELQVPHILDKFKEATIYPEEFSVRALAQQSIRYLPVSCAVSNSWWSRLAPYLCSGQ